MGDDPQLWLLRMERLDEEEREMEADPWGHAGGAVTASPAADVRTPGPRRVLGSLAPKTVAELKPVLERYAPDSRAKNKAGMIADIDATLRSPARLDAVVARLDPLERTLLEELKRRGGVADGWQLVTFAILRGHRLTAVRPPDTMYGRTLGRSAAVTYLTDRILDGLLQSRDIVDTWSPYGREGGEADLVTADPRLLDRIPDAPVAPVPPLPLDAARDATLDEYHPVAVVIELLDVLQIVADEGGLAVTRSGRIAKPFLNRLRKKRPRLGERLEPSLRTLAAMGLVRPPDDEAVHQPWPVDADSVARHQDLPLFMLYASIVDASCFVRDPLVDRAWGWSPGGNSRPETLWRSVLDALVVLPDHPVAADVAADALWEHVLVHVFGPAVPLGRATATPSDALAGLLAGPIPRLALLATGDAPAGAEARAPVLALTEGAQLYAKARAWLHHHERAEGEAEPHPFERGPAHGPPPEPALLIQPNFEILAYLDRLSSGALRALTCATAERIDAHTATFRIDRTSVTRALDLGQDVEEVLARLATHAQEVPVNVATAVHDWAARRERLRVHMDARVLEYASASERDAALETLQGARALAERFAILDPDAPSPATDTLHPYREAPDRTLTFAADGTIRSRGPLDLPARAALGRLTTAGTGGAYYLDAEAIRAGALTPALREALERRAREGIPPQLDALVRAWSGEAAKPTVATATLFRHPDASAWARHPKVGKLLATALSPSTYLVQPGKEATLRKQLEALGVPFDTTLAPDGSDPAAEAEGALRTGLSTAKKRELIEAAIEANHLLELRYVDERERYDRYGNLRRSKGKKRSERVTPEAIHYAGSLPYVVAFTLDRGTERVIRIGYIEAIAVRSDGDEAR